MSGVVKKADMFNMGLDLWLKRTEETFVEEYRDIVWAVFQRILRQTPQFTGKAVANWNLGIGAPDFSFDPSLGDEVQSSAGGSGIVMAHERGDNKWIRVAEARNKPKLRLIERRTKVYISNGVEGDTDNRRSGVLYLDSLQNPSYWAVKLREVNKPYETAQESVYFMGGYLGLKKGQTFKAGGANMGTYE